ncbi:hypothetical protein ACJIZ3_015737 [Penstemon smallii]|uniref:Basic blue protein n=1 Tax=Penstemon smallii TaxID=265156 RepID=A0ABD3RP49_9LAMI
MSGEKGNANFLTTVTVMVLGLVLHTNFGHSATYNVGDSDGWTYDVAGWENGKRFKAGDTLVFNYVAHSVVVVDKSSYDTCNVPANAKKYTSGNDKITLNKGPNYFICGIPSHCDFGMKIAAYAA